MDAALRDQEDAGIDVVSDGEMRRAGFFTAEFYRPPDGGRAAPVGPTAGRRRPRPAASIPGRGAHRVTRRAGRGRGVPLRVHAHRRAHQGHAPGSVHALRPPHVRAGRGLSGPDRGGTGVRAHPRAELERPGRTPARATSRSTSRLRPSTPRPRTSSRRCSTQPRRASQGRVRLAAHLCFGNYLGRPLAARVYRPVLEQALGVRRRRAGARVGQPRDGGARRGGRHRGRGSRPRRGRGRRQELPPRVRGRGRRRASRRSSRRVCLRTGCCSCPTAASARPLAGRRGPSCGRSSRVATWSWAATPRSAARRLVP